MLDLKKTINSANLEMIQMLELCDKDFKATIINMLQQAITNMLETN